MMRFVHGLLVACSTATPPAVLQARDPSAAISHAGIERTFESSWRFEAASPTWEPGANGGPTGLPVPPPVTSLRKYYLRYRDEQAAVPRGLGFKRTFTGIGGMTEITIGSQPPERILRHSQLEDVVAGYTQPDPRRRYECLGSVPTVDRELVSADPEITDLVNLLPSSATTIGDHWEVPLDALTSLLAPGGNLLSPAERAGGIFVGDEASKFHGVSACLELGGGRLLVGAKGAVTATLQSLTKTPNGRVAKIRLDVDVKNARDVTEDLKAAIGKAPEGARKETRHSIEWSLRGKGDMDWWIDAGYAKRYAAEAEVDVKESLVFEPRPGPGGEMPKQGPTLAMVWKGKVQASGSAEPKEKEKK